MMDHFSVEIHPFIEDIVDVKQVRNVVNCLKIYCGPIFFILFLELLVSLSLHGSITFFLLRG